METKTLAQILLWLYSLGGASPATFWLMEKVKVLGGLPPESKRYVSWVINAVLVTAGFAVAIAFGYELRPETWQAWVERLVPMVLVSIMGSQAIHARLKLSRWG